MTDLTQHAALVAQPRATYALERLLAEGRAHAVLLTGEPGNGTIAAAELLAQRTLCPNGGGDECDVCRRVARRVHPDLQWISPEGGTLAIDQIRVATDTVARMPFEAAAQVVVIEEADTLSSDNAAAGNSLLKALEEPAGRVVFALLARRPARMLPTIRSRVVEVVFPPVPDSLVVAALEADGVSEVDVAAASGLDLASVARVARGDLERARSIARGGDAATRRGDLLTAMASVVGGSAAPSLLAGRVLERATMASDAAAAEATREFDVMLDRMSPQEQRSFQAKSNDQGVEKRTARRARRARVLELRACLDDLAGWWRDVLAVHVGAPEAVVNVDHLEHVSAVAASAAGARAVAALDAIDEADVRLTLNNADEPVTIGALAAELAGMGAGRIRARRSLGAPARTPSGYDLGLA